MWLLFAITFPVSLLAGMGTGGAGLLVVFLTLIKGFSQVEAQGLNLFLFLFSTVAALCVHVIHTPPLWGLVLLLLPTGLLGAWAGSTLAFHLPQALLRAFFGYFLILTGGIGLLRKGK